MSEAGQSIGDHAPGAAQRRCPRCGAAMNTRLLPSHRPQPVPVDHCPDCRLVWFDALESVQLDGLGWTRLLRAMEDGRGRELALASVGRPACPHCHEPLRAVHNRSRFGRFSVLECPQRHGHLQSHTSLLAERGLVRPMGAAERRALAEEKHAVHCFNCGAPARATDDDCSWCGSPLVVVDLPRLAHSLRVRLNREFDASPAEQGVRVAWPCRGCGAPLDASRQTECPHCAHLVVAHVLPDLLPLLEAAEADLRRAARGRRALPGSITVGPTAGDAPQRSAPVAHARWPGMPGTGNAPIRIRRERQQAASGGERWRSWLPIVLLAVLGLAAIPGAFSSSLGRPALERLMAQPVGHDPGGSWALVALHAELAPADTRERHLLRQALLAQHLRQLVGERPDARATVGKLLEHARAQGVDHTAVADRWLRFYAAAWKPQHGDDAGPPPPASVEDGWRMRAPGLWWNERATSGLWRLRLRNGSAWPLPLHEVRLYAGLPWRCAPPAAGLSWVEPGEVGELVCRSAPSIPLTQDRWYAMSGVLARGEPPELRWALPPETERMRTAVAERWTADALARARAKGRPLLDKAAPVPNTEWRWQKASGAQRLLLVLGLLALGAAAYSTVARLRGIRAARMFWMLAAMPLAWWGGRGEGAASVLLVGMLLAVAVIIGLGCELVYRIYRAWLARRSAA